MLQRRRPLLLRQADCCMRFSRSPNIARFLTSGASHIHWERCKPPAVAPSAALPLVMIHGLGGGCSDWRSMPQAIANESGREVLILDNRGVGKSSAPDPPYSVDSMASDVLRVIDEAEVPEAHLLGFSLGGLIAQSVALRQPGRVCGLILCGTSHGGREAIPPPADFVKVSMKMAALPAPNESPDLAKFSQFMLPPGADEAAVQQFTVESIATARPSTGMQGQLAAMAKFNSTKRLHELGERHPVLIIHGEHDAIMSVENAQSLHRRIPNSEYVLWKGGGHYWFLTRPEEHVALLKNHLQRLDRLHLGAGRRGGAGVD